MRGQTWRLLLQYLKSLLRFFGRSILHPSLYPQIVMDFFFFCSILFHLSRPTTYQKESRNPFAMPMTILTVTGCATYWKMIFRFQIEIRKSVKMAGTRQMTAAKAAEAAKEDTMVPNNVRTEAVPLGTVSTAQEAIVNGDYDVGEAAYTGGLP